MSKLCKVFVFMLLIPFAGISQEEYSIQEDYDYRAGDIFFNINAGIDYNINAYREVTDVHGFTFYDINPHYNIGFDIGVMVSEKFRPRLEAKYVNSGYGQYWPEEFTTFEKTVTKIDNLDFNLQFDYLLVDKEKFKAFISPGIQSELALKDRFKTDKVSGYDVDDDDDERFSDLGQYYPRAVLGAGLSGILKWELNEYVGITFVPKYTLFLRKYQVINSGMYQRFSANIGLEFRLH